MCRYLTARREPGVRLSEVDYLTDVLVRGNHPNRGQRNVELTHDAIGCKQHSCIARQLAHETLFNQLHAKAWARRRLNARAAFLRPGQPELLTVGVNLRRYLDLAAWQCESALFERVRA